MAVERIDDVAQYEDSPAGWFKRWMVELDAAKEALREWRETQAPGAIARFLDKRDDTTDTATRKLNLYTSNVQTLRAVMYGKVPNATVTRRFGDAQDDTARVSAEILERCLNSDIERDGDGFKEAIGSALDDRLIGGLGQIRLRYTVEMGQREVPAKMAPMPMAAGTLPGEAVPMVEVAPAYVETYKVAEDVETDYVHWSDFLYSPCRTWADCRWVAFGVPMTRADLVARFGEEVGAQVPLDQATNYNDSAKEQKIDDVWGRAYVWEIWCKDTRKVYWLSEGYPVTLDTKDDPLQLAGFFPCPRPLIANPTTSGLVPVPDYYFAQDQYRELDEVTSRISTLQEAIAVRGVYDATSIGLKNLLNGTQNTMVPVENWALFAEKGGIKGQIDWFPLDMVIATMRELEAYRQGLIQQLYQITGLSDIVRGQASSGATATEQSIKARFASVRLQSLQDEVSRFASDVQKIRAEILVSQFDDQTILERANYVGGRDQQYIGPALALLRERFAAYRIEIKPENINLQDTAALKSERMEALQFLGQFLSNTLQLRQLDSKAGPLLNEMLAWAFASFKGSSQIEGAIDRYTAELSEAAMNPKPKPPPPQVQAEQLRQRGEMQKIQATTQADLAKTQAQAQADVAVQNAQARADLIVERAKEDSKMRAEERAAAREAVRTLTGGF